MLKTAGMGLLSVLLIAVLVDGPLRAQVAGRDQTWPATPPNPTMPTMQTMPTTQPLPHRPPTDGRPMPLPRPIVPNLPPSQPVTSPNLIPSFLQAGRTYAFQPVVGEPFVARVIALDAAGWIQVQRQPGSDVGPVAEYFNLQNIVAIKAQQ